MKQEIEDLTNKVNKLQEDLKKQIEFNKKIVEGFREDKKKIEEVLDICEQAFGMIQEHFNDFGRTKKTMMSDVKIQLRELIKNELKRR